MTLTWSQSAASKCLWNLCILDEIIAHIDGKTILQLAVTCKWVWVQLGRSKVPWRRALSNHEDIASFPGSHLRTAHTLVVLHFSSECVMCGLQTSNPILSNHAVRLCGSCSAQHLVVMQTHTIWQNGPHSGIEPVFLPDIHTFPGSSMARLYPAEPVQAIPADLNNYITSRPEPVEREVTSNESTASPQEFYSNKYHNPNYSSPEDINRGCGFPAKWDDEGSKVMRASSNSLTNNHGPYPTLCPHNGVGAGSPAGVSGFTTVSMARVYHPTGEFS
ncbi:hypothetical protein OPQ81_001076 [Rhizoctonia solani]|nr:hypothetical protein OPQ81_001076 [Rhizoctonia solani]